MRPTSPHDRSMASKLMFHLLSKTGRVQSREDLLTAVWGVPAGAGLTTRRVDAAVALIRRMIGSRCPVVTVNGKGYVVERRGRKR